MLSTAYHSALAKVNEYVAIKPVNWVKLFNELAATEEEKIILYYVCSLSCPDELADIYKGYSGITTPALPPATDELPAATDELPDSPVSKPLKSSTASKPPKSSKAGKVYVLVNEATKEEIEVSGASLTREPSPIGQVLSRSEKDKIIYYGKTVNGWYNKAGKLL